MDKPQPRKRKSIHYKNPLNEIKYNVKNNAIETSSKTSEKLQQKEINESTSDDDELSKLSSDEEEILNDVQQRRSSSGKYETHATLRNQQKRNVPSDNKAFDISSSLSHGPVRNVEPQYRKENFKQQTKSTSTSSCKDSGSNYSWWIIGIICFGIGFYLYYNTHNDKDLNINVLKCEKEDAQCITDNVKRTLKSMKAKYTNQDDDLWRDVFVGIKNIIHDPKKPSIIILLGDKSDPLDCLAVLLGNVSSNALNSDLLKLTPENFENDMGSVITSLRSTIKDKKAVIVWDLLNINEEALKAFHNLCDRINPLVEEVIYIITIIADDYDKSIKPLEYVEKKLYKKLSGKIKQDAIQPLITRITDGPILSVKPEPDLIDCPLPKVSKTH